MADDLPCAGCGARLTWNPGAGSLVCPYCGTETAVPDRPAGPWDGAGDALVERDLAKTLDALRRPVPDEGVEVSTTVRCPACAAEVGLDRDAGGRESTAIADVCPFCATPLSREATHEHRHPKPQGVLPFALSERDARARLKAWLGSRWFAPSDLKRYAEAGRPIRGVYVPHYTYDADATADYRGQRGDAYYVTVPVTVREGNRTRTEMRRERRIRWRAVSGRVRRHFDDVLVPASATLEGEAEVAGGALWDLSAMEGYRTAYLAGFRAEAPSLALDAGFERAAQAMEAALAVDVRADIGGDAQRITGLRATYDRVSFKHVLLPVWLAAYRYANRPYRVVVNGRTGRVTGERPYSWIKIALALLGLVVLIGTVWLATGGLR